MNHPQQHSKQGGQKPRLVHTVTQNGYFCQYYGEDINGVGGFSADSPEMAEIECMKIIHKIRERQLQTSPELSNFSPMSKGHCLIDPKLEMFFRVNGGIK